MNNITHHTLSKLPVRPINYSLLINEIGEARAILGELKGQLRHINPNLLAAPLLTREAMLSSRIEGTQATMEEVLKYDVQIEKPQNNEEEVGYKEILNYSRAVQVATKSLDKTRIGENLIKDTHRILMDSVRGASKNPGNFRTTEVAIGTYGQPAEKATYFPPIHTQIPDLINNWVKFMYSEEEKDVLVRIGIGHYQFEAIHPFMDGNGRIGRLLIPLSLYQSEIIPHPVIYISEYFDEHRQDYYQLLNNVTSKGEWEEWLKFFLTGIIETSKKTLFSINKMDMLYKELKDSITAVNSIYAISLLDTIFESPIVSFVTLKDKMSAKSQQTIYNLLQKFVEKGILTESTDRKRGKVYTFNKLIGLLE